jgi:hypothetical protein
VDPFFSRVQVQKYESIIVAELKLMETQFDSLKNTGKIITMDYLFAAMTGDLIGQICLLNPPSLVQEPDFSPDW